MKVLLSNGGGVNSPAAAIWLQRNEPETFAAMEIPFADTGGELPEVYDQILRFEKWLNAHGKKHLKLARQDETLEEHCLKEKVNPMRTWKWCTDKWKIRVVNEWADATMGRPRVHILGIAADEAHRATPNPLGDITNRYPLVEAGITRAKCHELLASEGMTGFVKSGCFFCPLTPSAQFVRLKQSHPDLFERACQMERNAGFPLKHKWLDEIVGLKDKQRDLFDGLQECGGTSCFT